VLCFMRTKHGASRLARQLEKDGLETSAIHGDKTQGARMDALAAFKEGKLEVLVATDVAARGLDVDDLPLVVNYELPHVPEDYIHRIGRTGRAGASGVAISLVDPAEEKYLSEIEKMLKKKVLVHQPEDYSIEKAAIGPRERGERPERTGRTSRTARTERPDGAAPRAPRAERAERAPRGEVAARPERQTHEERIREREEAYARNPDQPVVATMPAPDAGALGGHGARGRGAAARPVPMLLQKRASPVASHAAAPAAAAPAAVPVVASEANDEPRRAPDAVAPAA